MSDITIGYKGSTIATMDASGIKTLETEGKYCEDDITVSYTKPSIVVESDSEPYSFRVNAVDADSYTINKIIGGTVAWNQLVGELVSYTADASGVTVTHNTTTHELTLNGTTTARVTFATYRFSIGSYIAGHVYLFCNGYTSMHPNGAWDIYSDNNKYYSLMKASNSGTNVGLTLEATGSGKTYNNVRFVPQLFDLTQMFGSTIADYIYALEQSNAGSGVAYFRKLFPKPYYAFNAGELLSVQTSAHRVVGFNAYNPTTGTAKVVGNNQYQITGAYTTLSLDGATITPDENGKFTPSASGTLTVTGGNSTTTCVHLVWDGERNGEYEPYQEWNYPLDSSLTLRGILKLDASNNLYADGDRYLPDGTVERRYGVVDLGTLTPYKSPANYFAYHIGCPTNGGIICSAYVSGGFGISSLSAPNNSIFTSNSIGTYYPVIIKDASKENLTVEQMKTAMSGVYLVYELSTPTTESATPYTNIGRIGKGYTESFIDYRTPSMPVGHNTEYLSLNKQVNTVGYSYIGANPVKVMDIPETETALSATGFNTWTPSTTATTIVNSSNAGTLVLDLANYNYVVLWFYDISIAYNGTEENKAKILRQVQCMRHEIYKSPSAITALQQSNYDYNRYVSMFISALAELYNSSSTHTVAYVQAAGVYPYMTAGTFSNNTSDTPTITLKTPLIRASCNASYWSTANAGKVDKANSKFKLRGEVWRVDKRGVLGEMYKNIVDMYNA